MVLQKPLNKGRGRMGALYLLCLAALLLCGCAPDDAGAHDIICLKSEYGAYPAILSGALPSYAVAEEQGGRAAFPYIEEGAAAEVFCAQALSALENGVAEYWYPHYLATAIIAVNRDQTDAEIDGWGDLPAAGEDVFVFNDTYVNRQMLMAAIAYGLEGEGFTLGGAAALLGRLGAMDRFAGAADTPPILICYDYQAAAMRKSGRNIEIIVPAEGTLSYEKGLLSPAAFRFPAGMDASLLSEGYRLPDGRRDEALYAGARGYENARRITDYPHFNAIAQDITRVLRRDVLRIRLYTSKDSREHQLFALVYMILAAVWVASFIHRAMRKGVRRAALLTGIILLGWMAVRLVKYQFVATTVLNRYLWYSFYLFQLSLPLVLLWLAWAIDQPGEALPAPKWLLAPALANGALLALVLTNDFHNLVFQLDLRNPYWASEYGYGAGYYAVLAGSTLPLLAAIGMMLVKSGRNPRKRGFLFPLAFIALLALYGFGYITRVPFAWQSDFTMMIGLFTLLFVEACLRTGMIPVNTKYSVLFTHSPLRMRVVDSAGDAALSSAAAMQCDHQLLKSALKSYPLPVQQGKDTLLFATEIPGGAALWQEDVAGLNRLQAEMEDSVRRLTAANAVLAEEEEIKRALGEENARTQLMEQLEGEIAEHLARLSRMIERLDGAPDRAKETARIALLLCYVKRRCSLFFREREASALPAEELAAYTGELAEMAAYAGLHILVGGKADLPLPARAATLLFDFAYQAIDWALQAGCPTMLARLERAGGYFSLRLLPSEDARGFAPDAALRAAAAAAGGTIAWKDLDGAVGVGLSFPEGGGAQ